MAMSLSSYQAIQYTNIDPVDWTLYDPIENKWIACSNVSSCIIYKLEITKALLKN